MFLQPEFLICSSLKWQFFHFAPASPLPVLCQSSSRRSCITWMIKEPFWKAFWTQKICDKFWLQNLSPRLDAIESQWRLRFGCIFRGTCGALLVELLVRLLRESLRELLGLKLLELLLTAVWQFVVFPTMSLRRNEMRRMEMMLKGCAGDR